MIAFLHDCNYDQMIRGGYNQNRIIVKTVSFQCDQDDEERHKDIMHRGIATV